MALDTAHKRRSAIGVGLPWRTSLPLPDGTISTIDRQALLGLCSAIEVPQTSYHTPTASTVTPINAVQYTTISVVRLSTFFDVWAQALPAVYQVHSGELPIGFSLASNGDLSGAAINRGTFSVSVRVTDAQLGSVACDPFAITVSANPANSAGSPNAMVLRRRRGGW